MTSYDVFNGDADGICALVQLRNAEPRDARLITGVKRDIALLDRVEPGAGDRVTVLDVSLDKNRQGLERILEAGAEVFYADHHFPGEIPDHPRLEAIIDTAPDVCTSILINRHLDGKFVEWAIVGAFGDNLKKSAMALARTAGIAEEALPGLERLGILINYNGYGASVEDLHFPPDELFRLLSTYRSPQEFLDAEPASFRKLDGGYEGDMASARGSEFIFERDHAAIVMLPDVAWARRVSGVYGNSLANEHPDRAHAVITRREGQGYVVSVRAPLSHKTGADEVCRRFPTGGGRKAAAGINDLPAGMLDRFVETFQTFYSNQG